MDPPFRERTICTCAYVLTRVASLGRDIFCLRGPNRADPKPICRLCDDVVTAGCMSNLNTFRALAGSVPVFAEWSACPRRDDVRMRSDEREPPVSVRVRFQTFRSRGYRDEEGVTMDAAEGRRILTI